jgi:RNase P subunit RPR2
MNDDRSPLLTLISCITCKMAMRLEKLSPTEDGKDVIQYRCEQCGDIERVSLVRRTWPSPARSADSNR